MIYKQHFLDMFFPSRVQAIASNCSFARWNGLFPTIRHVKTILVIERLQISFSPCFPSGSCGPRSRLSVPKIAGESGLSRGLFVLDFNVW